MTHLQGLSVLVARDIKISQRARTLAGYAVSGMTIDELSHAWNDLHNAALGRGLTPNVSTQLATDIGNAYEQWRAYLAQKGASAWLPISPTSLVENEWVNIYRSLVTRMQAENVHPEYVLPATITEKMKAEVLPKVGGFAKQVGLGVATGLVVAGIMYYVTHRPTSVRVVNER